MNKSLFVFLFTVTGFIYSQKEIKYKLDSLIVTASRRPSSLSETGRSMEVINSKELNLLPVLTVQDVLEQSAGIDQSVRGVQGIQSDISIRGGTFEQTLIMIDGIKLTDPQTGHHNMNLPVSLDQVERIEILKGGGSGVLGANAFAGVVNIITKRNFSNSWKLSLQGGSNGFYKMGTYASVALGKTNYSVSLSKIKSDGYRYNTGFENYNFSVINSFNFSKAVIKTIYGITDKNFGANSFYTIKFPDQAEKTTTQFAATTMDIELCGVGVFNKFFWRRNDDEFVLNKHKPDFYKNNHHTNVYGAETQITTSVFGGLTSVALEYNYDDIESNNLGKHKRTKVGIIAEQKIKFGERLTLNLSGYLYKYSGFAWKFWPGFNIAYLPLAGFKVYANYGSSFRIPSYTELYYNDPITKGNTNLKPEEAVNYEIGFSFTKQNFTATSSFFRREGFNLIDYAKDKSGTIWHAKNISNINTNGFEFQGVFKFNRRILSGFIDKVKIGYTYLDAVKLNTKIISRYVLRYSRHSLSLNLFTVLPFGILQSWSLKYNSRINMNSYFLTDTKLQRSLGKFNVFIKVSNLFNKSYEEIPGVPLPGRWIVGGVNFTLL